MLQKFFLASYITYLDIQYKRINSLKLAKYDPKSAKVLNMINNKVKVPKTKKGYLGIIIKFIKYCISVNFNPFHKNLDPTLMIFYFIHRINDDNIGSLKMESAAIRWMCELLDISIDWIDDKDLIEVKKRIKKLFFVEPDKANPIFPNMILEWMKLINITINDRFTIPFDLLAKITIIQILTCTGIKWYGIT